MADSSQIVFNFPPHPYFGREDFMVSACNAQAFEMIDAWPEWPYFALCLYGPSGCGKTHLSRIFSDQVSVLTHYPYKIPCLQAQDLTLEAGYQAFAQNKCLIIENLSAKINQEAMFHIYNMYRDEGGSILFTSQQAPARLKLTLPDLQSRLNIVPAIEIKEPDDEMLSALIVKLFADRQLNISPEIISYMLKNMPRSFSFGNRLVAEIDRISLARKRAISLSIVKEALDELTNNPQGELFDL